MHCILGLYRDVAPIEENQMNEKMEDKLEIVIM